MNSHGDDHAAHAHGHSDNCDGNHCPSPTPAKNADVEKGLNLERIALNIIEMGCSGCCSHTLESTLLSIKGVHPVSVVVNPVTSNAELLFDANITNSRQITQDATTKGIRCELMTGDQKIDILASGDKAKELVNLKIDGVTQVARISKKVIRLAYNPRTIGARTLMRHIEQSSDGLAPHCDPAVASGRKAMYEKLWKTVAAALFTIPVLVLAWASIDHANERSKAVASLILATFVQFIAVISFYQPAISALIRNCTVEMDLLVVISISAAYAYSVVAFGFRMAGSLLDTGEFFETSTLLITLVLLGRLIASWARVRAVAAVSFRSLQSTTATIVEDEREVDIDARLLQYGDTFKVGPDASIPTDGTVISGSSDVHEAMLTGESEPVTKQVGSSVSAGTLNGSGMLTVRLTRLPAENTVTDIAELVEQASNSKPPIQDYADKVASWFVPVVGTVAVLCFVIWTVVGLRVRKQSAGKAVPHAITYSVATLAVSCPCALGLAVPMVLVVAGGIAARKGVVIKSAGSTERARKVTDVIFDKTGTITESELEVVEDIFSSADAKEVIAICKAVVAGNRHPVAMAVAKHLQNADAAPVPLTEIQYIPGAGIRASLGGEEVFAGNPRFTNSEDDPAVSRMAGVGMTILAVTRASRVIAVFGIRSRIRREAAHVISELRHRGIVVHLVSGDQPQAVQAVADQVGIAHVAAQKSPAEKRNYVEALMDKARVVLFAGDGTNDAVAITQADVGVQIGGGSEITQSAADVVLLSGLQGILFLLDISEVSFRRMCFNFIWSAIYNVLAILLASGAFVNVRIEPAYAGLGEVVSVLPVVVSAASMHLAQLKSVVA